MIELAVFVAFGKVLAFGLGVVELILVPLLAELLADGLSFAHSTVYNSHKQALNQNKDLSLSSKKRHIKYGGRSGIFEWFLNGKAEIELRDTW